MVSGPGEEVLDWPNACFEGPRDSPWGLRMAFQCCFSWKKGGICLELPRLLQTQRNVSYERPDTDWGGGLFSLVGKWRFDTETVTHGRSPARSLWFQSPCHGCHRLRARGSDQRHPRLRAGKGRSVAAGLMIMGNLSHRVGHINSFRWSPTTGLPMFLGPFDQPPQKTNPSICGTRVRCGKQVVRDIGCVHTGLGLQRRVRAKIGQPQKIEKTKHFFSYLLVNPNNGTHKKYTSIPR